MEVTPRIALANDLLAHTGTNLFLTGRAGTGKTTFLRELVRTSPKRMVVVAPTGVAAINAGGVTMHSFFQLPFGVFLPGMMREQRKELYRFSREKAAIIRSMDLLVIDEISMVRADTLDNIDEVLRRYRDRNKPFGGVQLLMIGDLQQLAPVVKEEEWALLRDHYRSPYFFDSLALGRSRWVSVELNRIYRQSDDHFIELLARVRDNRMDEATLAALNTRYRPDFEPASEEGYITLTSHNAAARAINDRHLEALATPLRSYTAEVSGDFPEATYPVDARLLLKQGAQVMFARNDSSHERRYVNGTIGIVTRLDQTAIEVQIAGGRRVEVGPEVWENLKYAIDPDTNQITQSIAGTFTQFPLKTAWAITIHKSQGLTFERAIIDAADSFSHGQVYVALSRCRTLEGIVLSAPLRGSAIISDATVGEFTGQIDQNAPSEAAIETLKEQYYEELLGELFDFNPLLTHYRLIVRHLGQHLSHYARLSDRWQAGEKVLQEELREVGLRFRAQLSRLIGPDYATNELLGERISKGAVYFLEKCEALVAPLGELGRLEIDNKEVRKAFKEATGRYSRELRIKLATLAPAVEAFSVKGYLEARSAAIAALDAPPEKLRTPKPARQKTLLPEFQSDALLPELLEHLCEWRLNRSREQQIPAFTIAHTQTLIAIANTMPASIEELRAIKGVGKGFMQRYSANVLEIVQDYRDGKI